jgi:NACalpha-BTF3-like transcription factor
LNLSNFSFSTDVSEDDIKLVMEQAQVNRAQAIKALQDHG